MPVLVNFMSSVFLGRKTGQCEERAQDQALPLLCLGRSGAAVGAPWVPVCGRLMWYLGAAGICEL